MPATAGRVRMPANNRVHSSAALQTHGIWQSAIGYDPYAPNKDDKKMAQKEPEADNAYSSFQGLLALARITGSNADDARGECKKCRRVGHLTFQCKNFVSVKNDKDNDPEAIHAAVMSGLETLKGNVAKGSKTEAESSDESSDSDYDSEMERAIADKYGKKLGRKVKSSRKKRDDSDSDDSDSGGTKKRGRPKKRRTGKYSRSDSDDEELSHRKRRDKRRKREESTDNDEDNEPRRRRKSRKDKRRRRSRRHSDWLDESEDSPIRYKRKSRRAAASSDTDVSGSEDSRIGRDKKRLGIMIRKRHHEDDE